MPIDKITPRQLDSDSDSKLVKKSSFLDALNLYSGDSKEGNRGVIKNIKGNQEILADVPFGLDSRLLGSVTDNKTDIVYLFVFSSTPIHHGVWAYDPRGILEGDGEEALRCIYRSNQFNFPSQGFVKGDVVHINNRTFDDRQEPDLEKDAILYFTDNFNEPRKLNVYRAYKLDGVQNIHGTVLINDDAVYDEADFITACPKAPVNPITFSFSNDSSRRVSNFDGEPGFQFAYQNIYRDGFESAISCYSDVAFPPSIINQGAQRVDHSIFNQCDLVVPAQGKEIEKVRILARKGNTFNFFILDEVDATPGESTTFAFKNERITKAVSESEVNKQFDNLPRRAQAQTVASNRLMYGNYIDGYDNVETSCIATLQFADRPQDFVDLDIRVKPALFLHGEEDRQKSTGFELDFSQIPDSYSDGDTVSLTLTFAPERNWHLYNFSSSNSSYHQTILVGPVEQDSPDGLNNGINQPDELNLADPFTSGENFLDTPKSFGNGKGVTGEANVQWKTVFGHEDVDGDILNNVSYGNSAGAPLIIKGAPVTFTANFSFTQDYAEGGRSVVADAVTTIVSFKPETGTVALEGTTSSQLSDVAVQNQLDDLGLGVQIQENGRRAVSSVSLDLNITDGQLIKQARIGVEDDITVPLARLITAVGRTQVTNLGSVIVQSVPCGFFIVNKAEIDFDLELISEGLKPQFIVALDSISDVDAVTVIHAPPLANADNLAWIAITKPTIQNIESGATTFGQFLDDNALNENLSFALSNPFDVSNGVLDPDGDVQNYMRQVGYLNFNDGNPILEASNDSEISIVDGEGGPGGGRQRSPNFINEDGETQAIEPGRYDRGLLFNQGSVSVNPDPVLQAVDNFSAFAATMFYSGQRNVAVQDVQGGSSYDFNSSLPLLNTDGFAGNNPEAPFAQIDFKRLHSHAEISTLLFFVNNRNIEDRSFKSSANHDFGIVYYDQRGRHGFVNPLTTVYVPGYSNAERNAPPGSVAINLSIDHDPPDWAHNYKIAYSRNTSVGNFIQYSSGGAFVQEIQDQEISESNQNIYVSLNYLQQHPISYSSSFGARGIDGGMNLYKFQEGDRLRIISFDNGGGENREYTNGFEFEVIDYRLLTDDESNPLANDPVPTNKTGAFAVLKNNPSAFGFDYSAVAALSDNWKRNCIIELYSPLKVSDEEDRIYYEIGDTGSIEFNDDGDLAHFPPSITLTKGDVWFRKVPVNLREFSGGQFKDLIFDDDGEIGSPTSNFKSVYLETMSATDLFASNSHSIGRPNVYSESAGEVIRESSITYSDPTDPSSKKPKFSSFNLSNINFADLPESYGDITYLANFGEYLVSLQKDKVSMVPVNRNILSDASGGQNIIASKEILGSPLFMDSNNGSDSPSSVIEIDSTIYFASSGSFSICKMKKSSRGVLTISDKNVTSLIRDEVLARRLEPGVVRIAGGYDPVKEEYLITIISLEEQVLNGQPQVAIQRGIPPVDAGLDSPSLLIIDSNEDGVIDGQDLIATGLITEEVLLEAGFAVATGGEIIIPGSISVTQLVEQGIITVTEIINSGLITAEDLGIDPALIAGEDDLIVTDVNDDNTITITDFIEGQGQDSGNFNLQAAAYMESQPNTFNIFVQLFNLLNIDAEEFINEVAPGFVGTGDGLSSEIPDSDGDNNITLVEALNFATNKTLIQALESKLEEQDIVIPPTGQVLKGDQVQNLLQALANLGPDQATALETILSDVNRDGLVATSDLLLFLTNFGQNDLSSATDTEFEP